MSRDSHKKCPKNAEKSRKIPEFVPNFIRSVHYFNRILSRYSPRPKRRVARGRPARASGATKNSTDKKAARRCTDTGPNASERGEEPMLAEKTRMEKKTKNRNMKKSRSVQQKMKKRRLGNN